MIILIFEGSKWRKLLKFQSSSMYNMKSDTVMLSIIQVYYNVESRKHVRRGYCNIQRYVFLLLLKKSMKLMYIFSLIIWLRFFLFSGISFSPRSNWLEGSSTPFGHVCHYPSSNQILLLVFQNADPLLSQDL